MAKNNYLNIILENLASEIEQEREILRKCGENIATHTQQIEAMDLVIKDIHKRVNKLDNLNEKIGRCFSMFKGVWVCIGVLFLIYFGFNAKEIINFFKP
jgi:hypothetical protein